MAPALRCVVFSRDRAMQLDAFLRSIALHAPDLYGPVIVLYRATTPAYRAGYDALSRDWPHVRWVEERNFPRDLEGVLGDEAHLVFHTDDDVFFRGVGPFSLCDDEVCFTLRLGLNTTYCYPLDLHEELRDADVKDDRVSWDWRIQGAGAFSYPLSLNGHVFRGDRFRQLVAEATYANPNELEASLQQFLDRVEGRMAAFLESSVVSIPANLVNETYTNRHGDLHPTAELNARFLDGERIEVATMDFGGVDACHAEIPYVFQRR